jgi:glyoxylase-like metal-dependent hydrolase (beta-lactamase superfamily II)
VTKDKLLESESLEVLRMVLGPYGNNVYLVKDRLQGCSLLIDAAAEEETLLEAVGNDRLVAILLTHAHMDHTQALEGIRRKTGAPVGLHPQEPGFSRLHPDIPLGEGQRISVGAHELEILHTPGHTPGSACFLLRPKLCFCGDAVFPGGPGKTGSPEAFLQAVQSLEKKIYTLPADVRLLPGHGEGILVEDSMHEYEIFRSRPRSKTPYGDVLWEDS